MAEGGRNPQQVFNIHIHGTAVDESRQEQNIGNLTEIHGSHIGTVTAGSPVQGEDQEEESIVEGDGEVNLTKKTEASSTNSTKLLGKMKHADQDQEDIAKGIKRTNLPKTTEGDTTKSRPSLLKSSQATRSPNEISGGTRRPTMPDGDYGPFIPKRVNQTYQSDSANGKTIPLKTGCFRISSHISVLEKEPISMSSRVFRAIHHSDATGDKNIVVKITPADENHKREAKIHFSVPHHKNIVERIAADVFDFRGQSSIYIAMERCDCNLYDHIISQKRDEIPFDAQKYLSIGHQIVVALDFLHSRNVVHGDLKPSNVLLNLGENVVKLCDFGLSRAISDDKTSTELSKPHGGTVGWQAPEVLKGTTKLGPKNDIFPLGSVLFHSWSYGKHPYGDESISWNHYIVKGENRNLDGMLIPNADSAKILLESMMQRNAVDRPTAREVLKHQMFAPEEKDNETKADGGKTSHVMSEENKKIRISFLKERISVILGQSEYLKASTLLEELASLQPTKELDTSLQKAECFLHLGRERKAEKAKKAIDAVKDLIVTSHALSAADLVSLGSDLQKNSSHVRAIILLRIASDLYKTNASSPDDVVNGIFDCISKTDDATRPMIKAGDRSRVIGLDFGVEYMKEMYEDLSAVNNADPSNQTLKRAWCLNWIGFNYIEANENEKSLKPRQTGVELLESRFGSDASKYRLYGDLLHNTGAAYFHLGKFSDAERYCVKAIEAYEKVAYFSSESERQSEIETSKRGLELAQKGLKKTRAKLGKI